MLLCEFTTIGKIPPIVIIDRFARFIFKSCRQDKSDPTGGVSKTALHVARASDRSTEIFWGEVLALQVWSLPH